MVSHKEQIGKLEAQGCCVQTLVCGDCKELFAEAEGSQKTRLFQSISVSFV